MSPRQQATPFLSHLTAQADVPFTRSSSCGASHRHQSHPSCSCRAPGRHQTLSLWHRRALSLISFWASLFSPWSPLKSTQCFLMLPGCACVTLVPMCPQWGTPQGRWVAVPSVAAPQGQSCAPLLAVSTVKASTCYGNNDIGLNNTNFLHIVPQKYLNLLVSIPSRAQLKDLGSSSLVIFIFFSWALDLRGPQLISAGIWLYLAFALKLSFSALLICL